MSLCMDLSGEFPSGPAVRSPHSAAGDLGSIPDRELRSHKTLSMANTSTEIHELV